MLHVCTLCLRFFLGPVLIMVLLVIAEIAQPSHAGSFWVKVGLAMAGFGLGSVLPYFSSDESLYLKFATIKTQGSQVVLTFGTEDKESFDFVKTLISYFFLSGLVLWAANYFLSERLSQSQPNTVIRNLDSFVIVRGFWLTGVAYCILAGVLFVYLSLGRKTNLMQAGPQFLADAPHTGLAGGSPIEIPIPEQKPGRRVKEGD